MICAAYAIGVVPCEVYPTVSVIGTPAATQTTVEPLMAVLTALVVRIWVTAPVLLNNPIVTEDGKLVSAFLVLVVTYVTVVTRVWLILHGYTVTEEKVFLCFNADQTQRTIIVQLHSP